MLSIICFIFGALLTFYGAFAAKSSTKKLEEVRHQREELTKPVVEHAPKPQPYVKIGRMDPSFNKELHECKLPKIGPYGDETKGWDIGTVIACTVPECGQEWVLGYYQETQKERQARHERTMRAYENRTVSYTRTLHVSNGQFYTEEMNPIIPEEVKKKWYTMEQYEANPDAYVYFS